MQLHTLNAAGKALAAPRPIDRRRRRLTQVLGRHVDHSRPFMVAVQRMSDPLQPIGEAWVVRGRDKAGKVRPWPRRYLPTDALIIVVYLPRGGATGSSGSRSKSPLNIALGIAGLALVAFAGPIGLALLGPGIGATILTAGPVIGATALLSITDRLRATSTEGHLTDDSDELLRQPEAVHISTDGAGYLMDGTPRGQGQKVALLAHLPAVIAVRGASAFVHMLGASISAHFLAFDDLLPEAPALFRGVRRQYRREMEARGLADIAPREAEFVIAGFSTARDQVEAYGMHSKAWNGGEPWALVPISEGALSPVDDQVMVDFDAMVDRIGDPRLMPEAAAVQIMESQRSRPFALEDGKKVVGVGGFCQLTTLTRAGITSRILKRWLGAVAV